MRATTWCDTDLRGDPKRTVTAWRRHGIGKRGRFAVSLVAFTSIPEWLAWGWGRYTTTDACPPGRAMRVTWLRVGGIGVRISTAAAIERGEHGGG